MRLTRAKWSAVAAHGIEPISMYGHTGGEARPRNARLLYVLSQEIAAVERLFIVGGDRSMAPSELARTGWLEANRAV